jgi:hypothetical protein
VRFSSSPGGCSRLFVFVFVDDLDDGNLVLFFFEVA